MTITGIRPPTFTRENAFKALETASQEEGWTLQTFQNSVGYEKDTVVYVTIRISKNGEEKPTHQANFNAFGCTLFALTPNYEKEASRAMSEAFEALLAPLRSILGYQNQGSVVLGTWKTPSRPSRKSFWKWLASCRCSSARSRSA